MTRTGRFPFGGAVAASLLLTLFLVAGCGASRETVTVTQRPEPIPSTEDSATAEARPAPAVPVPAGYDTVQARRFDQGKMWTFDDPPADYFESAYGFRPSNSWFNRARMGALRFGDGCSASFVSPKGLVMTNHHCGRDAIDAASREGEDLLEAGFYADSLEAERKAKDLHVDQLIKIENVTGRVYQGLPTGSGRAQARQRRVESLQAQMTEKAKRSAENLSVEVVALYNGAKYSAYTYRTYEDVRLVMAPELQIGFYGGTADNFTYPRYVLDVSFFRVYQDGEPLETSSYFEVDPGGSNPGDPVFVVGNPASTSRLQTVSQLEYRRDHSLPAQLDVLRTRRSIMEPYVRTHPDSAAAYDLRNTYFTIENSVKSMEGQLRGLRDPYLMARRAMSERTLLDSIAAVDSLQQAYGSVVDNIQQLQQSKRVIASKNEAFAAFGSPMLGSRVLTRGIYAYFYDFYRTRGATEEQVADLRSEAEKIIDWPASVEKEFIVARLNEIREAYGPQHPSVRKILGNRSPDDLAQRLVANSALMDSTSFAELFEAGFRKSDDPAVPVMEALAPLFRNVNEQMRGFSNTEQSLNAELSRARYAIYGSQIPPDATFTLRVADGRVRGYDYNGTRAPTYTNFYGLFDHYYSYNAGAWSLPEAWVRPPSEFDLETPLNLVTTNDIAGGNSGSPLLNENLEVVGLIFDSNIEALPNEFLYRQDDARAIAVDVRGILEAVRDLYDADRLAEELVTGTLHRTESAAEMQASEAQ